MAQASRLTNSSDETDVASLISRDNIFSIPFFQRSYKWKPEKIEQFQKDVLRVVDGSSDSHFLGAIILYGRRTNPADPDIYEVIDGQQRLTTIFLLICASVKILTENGEANEAVGLFQRFIVIPRQIAKLSNLKLHSCKEDRAQMNHVISDLLDNAELAALTNSVQVKALPVAQGARDKGPLRNNYNNFVRFLRKEFGENGIERVKQIYQVVLNQVTVVQIVVKDPTSGPKIFDSLNSKQEPMTIGDFVRNEIFAKIANEHPDEIEYMDQNTWQPFYKNFEYGNKNYFDDYFFPYGLTQNPNLAKSEVYTFLQKRWVALSDPKAIIDQIKKYQDIFIDLNCGTSRCAHSKELSEKITSLWRLGLPSSVFPFIMSVSRACADGQITPAVATKIADLIESFLVRRAVCGIEPTGLHSVFKRLWHECTANDTDFTSVVDNTISAQIGSHKTVQWPTDSEFQEAIKSRALYGAAITPYVVLEYEKSLGGDIPANVPHIEHIFPTNPGGDWLSMPSYELMDRKKDCLANLIPISPDMNSSIGNQNYIQKKIRYAEDSMFKSPRALSITYEKWDIDAVNERSAILAGWAIKRWPHQKLSY